MSVYISKSIFLSVILVLLLSGCSGGGDEEQKEPKPEEYTQASITELIEEGEYSKAATVLNARQKIGVGGIEELHLLLRVYIDQMDGYRAGLTIERLKAQSVQENVLVIPLAKSHFLLGQFDETLKVLESEGLRAEDQYDALMILGDTFKAREDEAKAAEYFKKALALDPERFQAHLAIALLAFGQGDLVAAEPAAENALRLAPEDPLANYAVGVVARYLGALEKGEQFLLRSLDMREDNSIARIELAGLYLERDEREKAEKQLDLVYVQDPDNPMARYYSALLSVEDGDFQQAEELLLYSAALTDGYPPAARAFGLVSYQLQRFSTASEFLGKYLRAVPGDRTARLALADSMFKRSDAIGAKKALAPLFEVNERDPDALLLAASIEASAGNVNGALSRYLLVRQVLEEEENISQDALRDLNTKIALSQYLLGDGRQAALNLKVIYGDDAPDAETLLLLANIQLENGDLKAAEQTVELLSKASTSQAVAFNLKGAILFRRGQLDDAIKQFGQALILNPDYFSALKNRGLALLAAKKSGAALKDLKRAQLLNGQDAQLHAFLGRAYLDNEDFQSAINHLTIAEKRFPKSPLILTDHAEALGAVGYYALAHSKADEALKFGANAESLVSYIQTLKGTWKKAQSQADLVLLGGTVHTVDEKNTIAEAIAIREGKIVFVGSAEAAKDFIGDATRVQKLAGKAVFPGFTDSHTHLPSGGEALRGLGLTGVKSADEVLATVKAYADAHPDIPFIIGSGWELNLFKDANPHKKLLDAIVPDRPVFLVAADAHNGWANSKALEMAGIGFETPDPVNGRIERDADGTPTGTLREAAQGLVMELVPVATVEEMIANTEAGINYQLAHGITASIDAAIMSDNSEAAYLSLSRRQSLPQRIRISLLAAEEMVTSVITEENVKSAVETLTERRRRFRQTSRGRIDAEAVKIFVDGVVENHTAALLAPYVGAPLGDEHKGEINLSESALDAYVQLLEANDFQVHMHAIGDRAVRVGLNAIENASQKNGVKDRRHQIAHLEIVQPKDVVRFKALGVSADLQTLWHYNDAYISDLTEPFLKEDLHQYLYPAKSFVNAGARIVWGSDWPVSSSNPFQSIEVAVLRKDPENGEDAQWNAAEALSIKDMIKALTINGAYLMGQEQIRGSLEVGKEADLIVLDADPYMVSPENISEIQVEQTYISGKCVYGCKR